jgi:hypothetical protein
MLTKSTLSAIALNLAALTVAGVVVWNKKSGEFYATFQSDSYKMAQYGSFYINDIHVGSDCNNPELKNLQTVIVEIFVGLPALRKLDLAVIKATNDLLDVLLIDLLLEDLNNFLNPSKNPKNGLDFAAKQTGRR